MNLLLLGETGVGKSTFINAFGNYGSFRSLEEATKCGGKFPIPSTFVCCDRAGNTISISTDGKTKTKTLEDVGESVTKFPSEHIFQFDNTEINLIDTLGLIDTKDVDVSCHDRDKENVSNVLRVVSKYDEIHAICVLIKASENRLSNTFKYSLTEILRHLDMKVCNNVIFIFTRTTRTPHQAQAILKKFLEENKLPISLPPIKQTVYCFENDIVQYLAEHKNKITHDEDEQTVAKMHWASSVESAESMLRYIHSLNPHSLKGVKDMYTAENAIRTVSKIVLDNVLTMLDDVSRIEMLSREAESMKAKIQRDPLQFAQHDLRRLLFIPETKVIREPLGFTNVVCESSQCAQVVNGEIIYPQICCRDCWSPWMYWCSSINIWAEWTRTKTRTVVENVYRRRGEVVDQIVDSNAALQKIKDSISQCKEKDDMHSWEIEQMLKTCAKLNTFVYENAAIKSAYVDEVMKGLQNKIETYEKELIKKKQLTGDSCRKLEDLRKTKREYETFLARERSAHCNVNELIQQLYKLPMKGNDLRKAMEEEEEATQEIRRESEPHTVLSLPYLFERFRRSRVRGIVHPQAH